MSRFSFSKLTLLLVAVFFVVATTPMSSHAVTGDVAAEVLDPLSLTQIQRLQFGDIAPGNSACDVTIAANDGSVSVSGGCNHVGSSVLSTQRGQFSVSGEDGYSFDVSLPSSVQLTDGSGNSMIADNFGANNGGSGTLSGGSASFRIGANLNVSGNQAPGRYNGSFTITASYQ